MVIFQGKIPSESDSAPVFSERLRIRIRNLHAGKHLLSQATMSVCAKGFMSTSNALKSAGQNFSENQNPFPFGDLMKPPQCRPQSYEHTHLLLHCRSNQDWNRLKIRKDDLLRTLRDEEGSLIRNQTRLSDRSADRTSARLDTFL